MHGNTEVSGKIWAWLRLKVGELSIGANLQNHIWCTVLQSVLVMYRSKYGSSRKSILEWYCPFNNYFKCSLYCTVLFIIQSEVYFGGQHGNIYPFLSLLGCNWQGLVQSDSSGNPLHWSRKSSAKPNQCGDHLGREFGDGWTGQPASGLLCPFWTDLCPAPGLPQVHEKHFLLYSAGNAQPWKRWADTQNSVFEKSA